jgi:hypothetical protein
MCFQHATRSTFNNNRLGRNIQNIMVRSAPPAAYSRLLKSRPCPFKLFSSSADIAYSTSAKSTVPLWHLMDGPPPVIQDRKRGTQNVVGNGVVVSDRVHTWRRSRQRCRVDQSIPVQSLRGTIGDENPRPRRISIGNVLRLLRSWAYSPSQCA